MTDILRNKVYALLGLAGLSGSPKAAMLAWGKVVAPNAKRSSNRLHSNQRNF